MSSIAARPSFHCRPRCPEQDSTAAYSLRRESPIRLSYRASVQTIDLQGDAPTRRLGDTGRRCRRRTSTRCGPGGGAVPGRCAAGAVWPPDVSPTSSTAPSRDGRVASRRGSAVAGVPRRGSCREGADVASSGPGHRRRTCAKSSSAKGSGARHRRYRDLRVDPAGVAPGDAAAGLAAVGLAGVGDVAGNVGRAAQQPRAQRRSCPPTATHCRESVKVSSRFSAIGRPRVSAARGPPRIDAVELARGVGQVHRVVSRAKVGDRRPGRSRRSSLPPRAPAKPKQAICEEERPERRDSNRGRSPSRRRAVGLRCRGSRAEYFAVTQQSATLHPLRSPRRRPRSLPFDRMATASARRHPR